MNELDQMVARVSYELSKREAVDTFRKAIVDCMREEHVSATVAADKVRAAVIAQIDAQPLVEGETTELRQEFMRDMLVALDAAKGSVLRGIDAARELVALEDQAKAASSGDVAEQIGADRSKDAY